MITPLFTKKINFCCINCIFVIEFDNNFKINIETKYFYNTDISNIMSYLSYYIDCFKSRSYNVHTIKHMINKTTSDRCNITNGDYLKLPMHAIERKIIMNTANNPQLINSLDISKIIL